MPNPLSRVLPGRPFFYLSHDALFDQKPELILDVMSVINTWSYCEAEAVALLSDFINAEFRTAYAMFNALTSSEARRAAVLAAAKVALSPTDLKLYEGVEAAVRPSRNTRNAFAHGLWGSLPRLRNSLLLVRSEDLTESHIAWAELATRRSQDDHPGLDYSKVQVYTAKELKKAREAAWEALVYFRMLRFCFSPHSATPRESRVELSKMLTASRVPPQKSQKKTRSARQQSRVGRGQP
jgi:hypothetical protein